jgi:hypothetical protein
MTYVSKREALVSQEPRANVASIVFRERGTAPFVRYLDTGCRTVRLDFFATIVERPEDRAGEPSDDDESGPLDLDDLIDGQHGDDAEEVVPLFEDSKN